MIKANDLRLGNWVETYMVLLSGSFYGVDGKRHGEDKVTAPTIQIKQIGINDLKIISESMLATYRPIPLSPEILEKCGFRHRLGNIDTIHEYFIGTNPVTHDWLFDLCYIDSDGNRKFFYRNGHHVVTYLHQLQNLYYCLVGEELQVKL